MINNLINQDLWLAARGPFAPEKWLGNKFKTTAVSIVSMSDRSESVHVHRSDAAQVIEEYRLKGYVLKDRTKPTIAAQPGFVKLIFIPAEDAAAIPPVTTPPAPKRKGFFI